MANLRPIILAVLLTTTTHAFSQHNYGTIGSADTTNTKITAPSNGLSVVSMDPNTFVRLTIGSLSVGLNMFSNHRLVGSAACGDWWSSGAMAIFNAQLPFIIPRGATAEFRCGPGAYILIDGDVK